MRNTLISLLFSVSVSAHAWTTTNISGPGTGPMSQLTKQINGNISVLAAAVVNVEANLDAVSNRAATVSAVSPTNNQALTGGNFTYVITPAGNAGPITNFVTVGTAGNILTAINVGTVNVRFVTGLITTLAGTNSAVTLGYGQSLTLIAPSATNWVQKDLQTLTTIP